MKDFDKKRIQDRVKNTTIDDIVSLIISEKKLTLSMAVKIIEETKQRCNIKEFNKCHDLDKQMVGSISQQLKE